MKAKKPHEPPSSLSRTESAVETADRKPSTACGSKPGAVKAWFPVEVGVV